MASRGGFQPLASFLPEVFKQQACHGPTFNMGRNAFFLVAPSLDRGSLVRGQSYLVMQLDRAYVRRLVVVVVRTLHAPLLAR